MKNNNQNQIEVWAEWSHLGEPRLVGTLDSSNIRGKEIFSFEYDKRWLATASSITLDPALKLFAGRQYLADNKPNFGVFLDSSPDRWGRRLIERRERLLAREEKRIERKLFESDYLLGVHDYHRMGGLRFKHSDDPFLDDHQKYSTPVWSSMRELETICLMLEEENIENNPQYPKWLEILFAPGSSLGGARPKASISDSKGHLWIAKFPSKNDNYDVGGWEFILHTLAKRCGLFLPEVNVKKIGTRGHIFLSRRFDRTSMNKRIHLSSAMTLLERKDGDSASGGASYLELVNFLIESGACANQDVEELYRRIIFYMCVSNTDDHLRNHAFLLTEEGWRLSPAYDINPNPYGNGLSLNISEYSNEQSLYLALDVCEYFRLDHKSATNIIIKTKKEVSKWRTVAKQLNITNAEQNRIASAFRLV